MAKKQQKSEPDSVFILKLVLFFILGGLWVATSTPDGTTKTIPVGLVIGLVFASHDHFQIDRKIEYAVLLSATILSYVAPLGLVLLV